jgi:hypothetical protein
VRVCIGCCIERSCGWCTCDPPRRYCVGDFRVNGRAEIPRSEAAKVSSVVRIEEEPAVEVDPALVGTC